MKKEVPKGIKVQRKNKTLNSIIWNVVIMLFALMLVALILGLVQVALLIDGAVGSPNTKLVILVFVGIAFVGVCHEVIQLYNDLKKEAFVTPLEAVEKIAMPKGVYRFTIVSDDKTGLDVVNVQPVRTSNYGKDLYTMKSLGDTNEEKADDKKKNSNKINRDWTYEESAGFKRIDDDEALRKRNDTFMSESQEEDWEEEEEPFEADSWADYIENDTDDGKLIHLDSGTETEEGMDSDPWGLEDTKKKKGFTKTYRKLNPDVDTETDVNGKTTSRKIKTTHLDRIEGLDELKVDIVRMIDSLVNPEKYKAMGARPTKGVLLIGPPGTGKTMIAKAVAADANATFISASGSDFIEKYVGVGAKRVREMFRRAKEKRPAILFIDEIDAIAMNRDSDTNSENLQTIDAFLTEMDGFTGLQQVLVMAATNRADLLDSAFTRPGRFDLQLTVGLPDKEGREKILKVHSENKKFSADVSMEELAGKTVGFSGAELENLLNEAALIAASLDKKCIEKVDVDNAFYKILTKGHKRKRDAMSDTNRIVAWHESGHALAIKLLTKESVPSVTIVGSTSGIGGITFRSPLEDSLMSKLDIEAHIMTLYAGRAAEEILLGSIDKVTTGASQDIKQATSEIRKYLGIYGMGEGGMLDVSQFTGVDREQIAKADSLAKRLYTQVFELLSQNKDRLQQLAELLMEKETISEDEIDSIINGHSNSKEVATA